jgi:transcriptional regulator of arginine metabolism
MDEDPLRRRIPRMSSATRRRATLRKLLLSGVGGTQSDFCERLAERGFPTTQSTISRDLKLLGAERRVRDDGSLVYVLGGAGTTSFPSEMIVGVEANENQIIVKTRIGRAQAVGLELDALRHPDLLGTIAGDDTVLVIPRSIHKTQELAQRIKELAELQD